MKCKIIAMLNGQPGENYIVGMFITDDVCLGFLGGNGDIALHPRDMAAFATKQKAVQAKKQYLKKVGKEGKL